MFYYARSLLNASFLMVNSTWTKNHVDAVLEYGVQTSLLNTLHGFTSRIFLRGAFRGLAEPARKPTQIVYPPCDTKQMSKFPLEGRHRIILSLAQFRYVFVFIQRDYSLKFPPDLRRITLLKSTLLLNSSTCTPSILKAATQFA